MPADTFEMTMIHRVLRREIGRLPELVVTSSDDPERRAIVADHAGEVLQFLHIHHHGEDELVWPVLRPRVPEKAELIDHLEAAHTEVSAALDTLVPAVNAWSLSGDPAQGEQLAAGLRAMQSTLVAHLDEEEAQLLPIAAEYMTQDEWNKLGEHGLGSIPQERRMFTLGAILAEANDDERSKFLSHVPPPVSAMYEQFGEQQYAEEISKLA
jgi:hemerythrin-like domain-containing protein